MRTSARYLVFNNDTLDLSGAFIDERQIKLSRKTFTGRTFGSIKVKPRIPDVFFFRSLVVA